MSELNETLARWRRETEKAKPSAALMVEINALAAAQPSAPAGGAKAVGMKAAVVVIVVAVLGVLGLLLLLPKSPGPVTEVQPPRLMQLIDAPAPLSSPAPAQPKLDPEPTPVPAAPAVPPKRSRKPTVPTAPESLMARPGQLVSEDLVALPATPPPRLARAVEGLAFTCRAQRNVLVELIRDHAHEDPEAAAAAFARWTLLCRTVSGPAIDTHRWFWPWGLKSGTGSSCKTDLNEPSCADGENISASIESAAACVRDTTPGTCARRGARIQAVFAACEKLLHRPAQTARSAVDESAKQLTDEFGPELSAAAWCLNSAALHEGARLRGK